MHFELRVPVDEWLVTVVSHRRAPPPRESLEQGRAPVPGPALRRRDQRAVIASRCGSDSTSILRGFAVSATGIVTVSTPFS